nr:PREDICTED: zinc finger protein 184-like [Bemisia tabaci]
MHSSNETSSTGASLEQNPNEPIPSMKLQNSSSVTDFKLGCSKKNNEFCNQPGSNFKNKSFQRITLKSLNGFLKAKCRVCGINATKCLKIFNEITEIANLVNTYLPIQVGEFDPYPKTICLECLGILQTTNDLAYRASQVDIAFRNNFEKVTDSTATETLSDNNSQTRTSSGSSFCESKSQEKFPSDCSKTASAAQADQIPEILTSVNLVRVSSVKSVSQATSKAKPSRLYLTKTNVVNNFVADSNELRQLPLSKLNKRMKNELSMPPQESVRYTKYGTPIKCSKKSLKAYSSDEESNRVSDFEHSYAKPANQEPEWLKGLEGNNNDFAGLNSEENSASDSIIDPTSVVECMLSTHTQNSEDDSNEINIVPSNISHSDTEKKPAETLPTLPLGNGKMSPVAPKGFEISSFNRQTVLAQVSKLLSKEFLNAPSKPISGTIQSPNESPAKKRKRLMFTISQIDPKSPVNAPQMPRLSQESFPKYTKLVIHGCYICNKKFGTLAQLLCHMQTHAAADKCCPVCERVFSRASIQPLLHHRKVHSEAELKKWTTGSDEEGKFKCERCSKFFISRVHKTFHDVYHHDLKIVACGYCDGEYITEETVIKHRKVCSANGESFKRSCPLCFREHQSLEAYQEHIQNHAKDHTCDLCFSSFISKGSLQEHIQIDHADKPYTCDTCGKSFVSENCLQQHQESFHRKLKQSCHLCSATFSSLKQLTAHTKTHIDAPLKCTFCSEIFQTSAELKTHRASHSELVCYLCNAVCINEEKCVEHVARCRKQREERLKDANPEKNCDGEVIKIQKQRKHKHLNLACNFCHKKFSDSTSLRNHETIHSGERPHLCSQCGKTFRTSKLLLRHSRLHSDINCYACQYCSESFQTMDKLYIHKRTKHTNKYSFKCDMCNHTYSLRKHFIIHSQICKYFEPSSNMSSEKTRRCMLCPKVFTALTIMRHERIAHDPKYPAICNICDEQLTSVLLLRKHLERHYNNNEIKNIRCPNCLKICADDADFKNHDCDSNGGNDTREGLVESQAQQAVESILPPLSPLSQELRSFQSENLSEAELIESAISQTSPCEAQS